MKRLLFSVFQEENQMVFKSNGRQPLSSQEMIGLACGLIELSSSLLSTGLDVNLSDTFNVDSITESKPKPS